MRFGAPTGDLFPSSSSLIASLRKKCRNDAIRELEQFQFPDRVATKKVPPRCESFKLPPRWQTTHGPSSLVEVPLIVAIYLLAEVPPDPPDVGGASSSVGGVGSSAAASQPLQPGDFSATVKSRTLSRS